MLRALERFLGTGVPVFGVNFGRVGFLTSLTPRRPREGLARVFAGEYTCLRAADPRGDADGGRCDGGERRRRTSSSARADGAARLGGRRRAPRRAGLRRRDLLDAVRDRPRTTSRTAARCSSGAWTRSRSPSSRRTRCTRARSSSRAAGRHDPQRDARRRRSRCSSTATAVARGRARRRGRDPPRRPADPARVVTGGDVLPALSRHIRS